MLLNRTLCCYFLWNFLLYLGHLNFSEAVVGTVEELVLGQVSQEGQQAVIVRHSPGQSIIKNLVTSRDSGFY